MSWWLGQVRASSPDIAEGDRVCIEICKGPERERSWLTVTQLGDCAYRGMLDDKGSKLVKQLKKGSTVDFLARHVMGHQPAQRGMQLAMGVQQELFG